MIATQRDKHLRNVLERVAASAGTKTEATVDSRRREAIQASLKEVKRRHEGNRKSQLREMLMHADVDVSPARFVTASACFGLLMALITFPLSPVAALLAALAGGLGAPRIFLSTLIKRRRAAFLRSFPEALDIIIRGVRSGLPVGECLVMIAREIPAPVGSEFALVTEGVRLGMTMEESLQRLSRRIPTPEARFFTIVVGIQQQTGGNLAETLAKLSDVLRARKRMRDKIQAMSGEAKASAGIIGSLPLAVGLMLTFIAPDYVAVLVQTPQGNLILLICAILMGMGIMVMRGMINFEI